jgi:hypothetical protein
MWSRLLEGGRRNAENRLHAISMLSLTQVVMRIDHSHGFAKESDYPEGSDLTDQSYG